MKHPLRLALASIVLVPALQAQGAAPTGLTLVSSTRDTWSQTYVFDSTVNEHQEIEDEAPGPIGPWVKDLDLQAVDSLGVPIGRARTRHTSDVQRTEFSFDLDLEMTTTGNHAQEDATGSSTYRIQFSTSERMRFSMEAQTNASQGYNRAVVDLHSVTTPANPIATVFSFGAFSSGSFDGWLQPGEYVFYANAGSLAGGGGAGPADSRAASCSGFMRFFHECDYDLDGDLDLADRQAYLQEWFAPGNVEATDMDGDGDSDLRDAVLFIIQWRYGLLS